MTVKKYRKLPVEIEAVQFTGGAEQASEIIDWIIANGGTAHWTEAHEGLLPGDPSVLGGDHDGYRATPEGITVHTLEGHMFGGVGWWFLRGIAGEFYPCDPDVFKDSYEEVGE
jgi:hypothetical protein